MWQLFLGSVSLFFKGRLFADQKMAFRQISLGVVIVFVLVTLAGLAGAPVWLAAVLGGLIGGAAAPVLCINLRMR